MTVGGRPYEPYHVDDHSAPEPDPFHDADGHSTIPGVDPIELAQFAHDCWLLGLDPVEVGAELRRG